MNTYYSDATTLFLNGEFVPAREAVTDLYGQTLHYGYGVFEGIRAYQTVHGTKIFQANAHFERLAESCRLMNIPLRYSPEELTQISYQVLKRNNLSNAYLRPLVFCSPNMSLTTPREVSVMISAWDWGKYFCHPAIRVGLSSYERPNPKSIRVEAKTCGNYVSSILATSEAKALGYDEALMLDMHGFVAEGPGANFFLEKDGQLITPDEGSILPGITRRVVIDIARELDIPVVERKVTPRELETADAAFFCGTAAEITPIASINGATLAKPWSRSASRLIQEAYQALVLDKNYSYVIV